MENISEMITEITMYGANCDACGCKWHNDDGIVAFTDKSSIEQVLLDSEWEMTADKYYCPNCWGWNDEGEMIYGENISKELRKQ